MCRWDDHLLLCVKAAVTCAISCVVIGAGVVGRTLTWHSSCLTRFWQILRTWPVYVISWLLQQLRQLLWCGLTLEDMMQLCMLLPSVVEWLCEEGPHCCARLESSRQVPSLALANELNSVAGAPLP